MKMTGFASPKGDKAYFFFGSSYVRYDVATDKVEDGYPLSIADQWPGLFDSDIDACIPWDDGTVFFFKGDQCLNFDLNANAVVEGSQSSIGAVWPGVFPDGIDAGVLLASNNVYFFRGAEYVAWDTTAGAVAGSPTPITNDWAGLFDADIEAAVRWWSSGKLYFFRAGEYAQYDVDSDTVPEGYPKPVAGNWPGLPFGDSPVEPGPGPAPVVTDGTPARQLSTADARAELQALMDAGVILFADSTQLAGKVDMDGLIPMGGGQKQDGNVAGVVIRYLESGSKHIGTPAHPNAPDRLDPRNALALVRFCQWLNQTWGVTELYHLGIDGDGSGARTDCHGQGRAIDFVGVKGVRDGAEFVLTVLDDWGTVDTPSTPGGTWQPVGTNATHFRLDDAPSRAFERDFFRSAYDFIASQWQDRSANADGPGEPSAIGTGTFIMNPDHPTSAVGTKHGREAHNNHFHMQIGVTGTA